MRYLMIALTLAVFLSPAASQALNVAVVDMQRVMSAAKAANSARAQLEAKQKSFQADVAKTEASLQKKDQELAKQRSLLAADEFKNKLTDFRKSAANAQNDVQKKRMKLRRAFEMSIVTIQKKVTAIVGAIAKEKQFDVVVPTAQTLYFKDSLDITAEVLKRLDAQLPSMKVDFTK